ncbi:hypothetical protein SAMN04487886_107717 [Clostridium sp. DSM 8431]|uniref:hypothetical protein n=1 Tax=Clostridium sp. DSM 8431 TaxID=1761781 RepID=UPI0008DEF01A|nr:hypothetical protein [Clostridium sp. DSM 8431]SFU62065.1 hypothetical protein SAMN04487886_107717 [Clostridium sp. DSM 8431]
MMEKSDNMYYLEAQKVYESMNDKKNKNYDSVLYDAMYYKDLKEYGKALNIINLILKEDNKNEDAIKAKIRIIKELKNKNL